MLRLHLFERRYSNDDGLHSRRIAEIFAHPLNLRGILGREEFRQVDHIARVGGLCRYAERRSEALQPHAVFLAGLLCEIYIRSENSGGVVFLSELVLHRVEHAARIAVRDLSLKAVADLDAELAVLLGDEQENAVALLRVADAPAAEEFVCVRFDVRAVQGVNGHDDELRFRFFAQLRADLPDPFGISRTDHARRIDDVFALRRSGRHGGIGG